MNNFSLRTFCTKEFSRFPAAHRQPNHDGHCSLVHGHDWSFEITFQATALDGNNFVVDFGKLKSIKKWLTDTFDHTLLINEDDPELSFFADMDARKLCRLITVPSASAEGLAKYVLHEVSRIVRKETVGRVSVVKVTCREDDVNSATVDVYEN